MLGFEEIGFRVKLTSSLQALDIGDEGFDVTPDSGGAVGKPWRGLLPLRGKLEDINSPQADLRDV